MELLRGLSQELDINLMLSTLGHFTLAHTDSSVRVQRERGETNQPARRRLEADRPRRDRRALPAS